MTALASPFHDLQHAVAILWSVAGPIVLCLVLLELAFEGGAYLWDRFQQGRDATYRGFAAAYPDAPWRDAFLAESAAALKQPQWHSYVYWRSSPFVGQYVNVDEHGRRQTWRQGTAAAVPAARPVKVFMFGGSTTWGTGARDDFTIASQLAKLLAADPRVNATVTNFGETGYISTQETIALLGELQRGNVPDVVIFYDGMADVFAAYQNRAAATPLNESNRRAEFTVLNDPWGLLSHLRETTAAYRAARALLQGIPGQTNATGQVGSSDQLAEDVVRVYLANLRAVQALAQTYGFEALFFWQPTIFTKDAALPREQRIVQEWRSFRELSTAVYGQLEASPELAAQPNFHNISRIIPSDGQLYYLDVAHLTEAGDGIIARRMATDLQAAVDRRLER